MASGPLLSASSAPFLALRIRPPIRDLGAKFAAGCEAGGDETVDSLAVERPADVAFPADCNFDEDHVSSTVVNADAGHDPRTGDWGRIGHGVQDALRAIYGQEAMPHIFLDWSAPA